MQRPSPSASSSRWPSQFSSYTDSWPGHTFKRSPVEDLAEYQCQLMSWEELRPLCQARTTSVSKVPNHLKPLDCNSEKLLICFRIWFSHHVQGYTVQPEQGHLPCEHTLVVFTSSIYSCLHVQHTQQTGDLPPHSTSGIITVSLPF